MRIHTDFETHWQKYQRIEYKNNIPWKHAFLARHL